MIYDPTNAAGAKVFEVETMAEIKMVSSIDTEAGEVACFHQPLRLNATHDQAETFTLRFASIYPIQGSEIRPVLFHCYGRKG